jgi:hypothetical protein
LRPKPAQAQIPGPSVCGRPHAALTVVLQGPKAAISPLKVNSLIHMRVGCLLYAILEIILAWPRKFLQPWAQSHCKAPALAPGCKPVTAATLRQDTRGRGLLLAGMTAVPRVATRGRPGTRSARPGLLEPARGLGVQSSDPVTGCDQGLSLRKGSRMCREERQVGPGTGPWGLPVLSRKNFPQAGGFQERLRLKSYSWAQDECEWL